MKNTKKIHLVKNIKPAQGYFRVLPIAAALAASGFIQPALAVDRTWFGGNGDLGTQYQLVTYRCAGHQRQSDYQQW